MGRTNYLQVRRENKMTNKSASLILYLSIFVNFIFLKPENIKTSVGVRAGWGGMNQQSELLRLARRAE